MPGFSDPAVAARAVADPSTPAADIADIASHHPELWPQIAAHPNASPTVLDSLRALGDDSVKAALAGRPPAEAAGGRSLLFPPPATTQQVATPPAPSPDQAPRQRIPWPWIAGTLAVLVLVGFVLGSRYSPFRTTSPVGTPGTSPMSTHSLPGTEPTTDAGWTPWEPVQIQVTNVSITDLASNPNDSPQVTTILPTTTNTVTPITFTIGVNPSHTIVTLFPPVPPTAPLTVAQFADMITTEWPNISGRPAMQVSGITYFNCPVMMYQLKDSRLASAVESPGTSSLRMELFDSAESAGLFQQKMDACFAEMGMPPTTITSFWNGNSQTTPPITMLILPHRDFDPVQVIYLHQWGNIVLMDVEVLNTVPDGADAPTQNFRNTLVPAFEAAVSNSV